MMKYLKFYESDQGLRIIADSEESARSYLDDPNDNLDEMTDLDDTLSCSVEGYSEEFEIKTLKEWIYIDGEGVLCRPWQISGM